MIIVDAYNLLHLTQSLPGDLAHLDMDGLLALIVASRFGDQPLVMVCDGAGPPQSWPKAVRTRQSVQTPNIRLIFSGRDHEADDTIERMLAERPRVDKSGRSLLVVSSDKRIQRAATLHGFEFIRSEAFLARLVGDRQNDQAKIERDAKAADDARRPLDAVEARAWSRHLSADSPEVAKLVAEAERALQAMKRDADQRRKEKGEMPHAQEAPARRKAKKAPEPEPTAPAKAVTDPDLKGLLNHYGLAMHPDDLDMDKWLKAQPKPDQPRSPPPPRPRSGRRSGS